MDKTKNEILLFLWMACTSLLPIMATFSTSGHYVCDHSRKMIVFLYSNGPGSNHTSTSTSDVTSTHRHKDVFDIYMEGMRSSCSKQSGKVKGQGSRDDPYTMCISIDRSENQSNDTCFLKTTASKVYHVNIVIQQLPFIVIASDQIFSLSCDFRNESQQTTAILGPDLIHIVGKPPGNMATVDQSRGRLTIIEDSSTEMKQDLPLGKSVRLQAEVNGTGALGVHVSSCTVSPSPGKQPLLLLLDKDGCSTDLKILDGFHGINKDGSIARTNHFEVFKFTTSNTLYFTCKLDFCYVHGDPFCAGNHCQKESKRRDKRSDENNNNNNSNNNNSNNNNSNNNNNNNSNSDTKDRSNYISTFLRISTEPKFSAQTSSESKLEEYCVSSRIFVLTTSILCAFLLLALILSSTLCARLTRKPSKPVFTPRLPKPAKSSRELSQRVPGPTASHNLGFQPAAAVAASSSSSASSSTTQDYGQYAALPARGVRIPTVSIEIPRGERNKP